MPTWFFTTESRLQKTDPELFLYVCKENKEPVFLFFKKEHATGVIYDTRVTFVIRELALPHKRCSIRQYASEQECVDGKKKKW